MQKIIKKIKNRIDNNYKYYQNFFLLFSEISLAKISDKNQIKIKKYIKIF